jgi:hypothetical protein
MGVTIGAALMILHALKSPREHDVASGGERAPSPTPEDSSLRR